MIIKSKYTKIFKSHDMTRQKYNELYDFAVLIRNHKNIVSEYVNQNLLHFLEYNKFMFLKEMREHFKGCVPSSFDAQLYTQIFDCYQNKFDAIQKRLKFEQIIYKGCELYKRTTKKHNKGDFKKVITENKNHFLKNKLLIFVKITKIDTYSFFYLFNSKKIIIFAPLKYIK